MENCGNALSLYQIHSQGANQICDPEKENTPLPKRRRYHVIVIHNFKMD